MKKIVSFICVLTMVITLLPLTTNASTNTTTLGLYDSCDCTWIFYQKNSKNFQSSNPNVVKIINNQMLGVSVGSATVTATVGTKKVKQKVVVERNLKSTTKMIDY